MRYIGAGDKYFFGVGRCREIYRDIQGLVGLGV